MKAGIIGANGYGGVELIRLLEQHPFVQIEMLISHSTSGMTITELYPHLTDICEQTLEDVDVESIPGRVDLMFFATPPGVSQKLVPPLLEQGVICIDLSGDFRLKDPEEYTEWYHRPAAQQAYLNRAVYGLAEINQDLIKTAQLIANPGCYPTAALLGLLPAVKSGFIDPKTVIIDGKTGISGAGRNPSITSHFSEVNENFKAYKLGAHKHTPEIEQLMTQELGQSAKVTFSTHLVPMTRGIMCTIYADLKQHLSTSDIVNNYQLFYESDPFVRIRETGLWPGTKDVYGSNDCDISIMADERTNRLTIVSVIDNLVKGASGQAVQNMNLLNGWDVRTGLKQTPVYP
ncbi:N-acetyl-gamma-glutamyl-phosphate reductase [Tuberibacillus sp. Marseille-P3662]|uniref:N-acetyl-gamma-glutamyl-phosphate reductase n=1 Tax=Tuberibacillus sp. Marseille-P3662 TaxID=1965358 RepID=UPI000A1CDA15|nr:N-acetyl-gamma-glutamyl-phosphate reductase [Tuberibacillus sp. Marseille-P3662]